MHFTFVAQHGANGVEAICKSSNPPWLAPLATGEVKNVIVFPRLDFEHVGMSIRNAAVDHQKAPTGILRGHVVR
jgi:hypothetical protein